LESDLRSEVEIIFADPAAEFFSDLLPRLLPPCPA